MWGDVLVSSSLAGARGGRSVIRVDDGERAKYSPPQYMPAGAREGPGGVITRVGGRIRAGGSPAVRASE